MFMFKMVIDLMRKKKITVQAKKKIGKGGENTLIHLWTTGK